MFWKRFGVNGFSFLVEVMSNQRERCLRVLKVANGIGSSVLMLIEEISERRLEKTCWMLKSYPSRMLERGSVVTDPMSRVAILKLKMLLSFHNLI